MEQDFGSNEGKSFRPLKSAQDQFTMQDPLDSRSEKPRFVPPESAKSMEERMDRFLDLYLLPILSQLHQREDPTIAIVSHGIILAVLWRRVLHRLPSGGVSIDTEMPKGLQVSVDKIRHWSNTGYLELEIVQQLVGADASQKSHGPAVESSTLLQEHSENVGNYSPQSTTHDVQTGPLSTYTYDLASCHLVIKTINGKSHLQGLKRTRGGIGSSKHDEGQQRIDMFMKRKKIGEALAYSQCRLASENSQS
jgi:hypothetical protein